MFKELQFKIFSNYFSFTTLCIVKKNAFSDEKYDVKFNCNNNKR